MTSQPQQHADRQRTRFRFGLFETDPAGGSLTRDGVRVKIHEQPFRVLVALLERPGEVVSRGDLRRELWPDGTYVDFDECLNVILKKLRAALDDDSNNPRFVETVPRKGYRFIAPVERVSESRPEALKLVRRKGDSPHLLQSPAATDASLIVPLGRRWLYSYLALPAGLLMLAASAWLMLHGRTQQGAHPSALSAAVPVHMRKSVAVLDFQNAAARPKDAWLGAALSEMLRTELAAGDKLRLVSGEEVANLRLSTPWPQTDSFEPRTMARIGSELNADLLVSGSYTVIRSGNGSQVRIDVRLQDAKNGSIASEIAASGQTQQLFSIVSRIGTELRARLGIPELRDRDEAGLLASVPLDPDAARFYALGLENLRQSDAAAAADLLQQAILAAPKFSLAHAALARAYSELGYEQKKRQEAKKAWELSRNLPQAERLLVEGDYYESLADHEKAASTYRALFELYPDNVAYGLQLASAQRLGGDRAEALDTLRRLRQLPPPAGDDPRIDLEESWAIPDNKPAELALVRAAMSKAKTQGKKLLYAQARKDECMDLAYADQVDQATAPCKEAYGIYLAAGNRLEAADALRLMADIQGTKGQSTQAIATYQQALEILRQLGEYEKTGAVLNNMAINFANEGRLDEAERYYTEAKHDFEQAGDKENASTALGNLADVQYLRGDLRGAERLYDQTLQARSSLDSDPSYLLYRLADLHLTEGHVREARRGAQEAIKLIGPQQGSYQYLTSAMIVLGEALESAGDPAGARQEFQQALDLRQKYGETELVAESQVELAQLDIEEGSPNDAEPLLRAAIPIFEAENADPDTASAYVLLSRAFLVQGKLREAQTAIQRAIKPASTSADPALQLPLAIQRARVEIATARQDRRSVARFTAARRQLQTAIATARKLGYYQMECEARLVMGELDLQRQPAAGRSRLAALAAEARGHGLGLWARQAEQAMAEAPPVPLR